MAGRLLPVQVGGLEVMVETMPAVGSEQTSKTGDAIEAVGDAFARAQETIVKIAESTVEVMSKAAGAARPDRMEVEFGLKISAKGHVVIAGVAGEATLRVTLTYEPNQRELDEEEKKPGDA
jgi:hypothetical protein